MVDRAETRFLGSPRGYLKCHQKAQGHHHWSSLGAGGHCARAGGGGTRAQRGNQGLCPSGERAALCSRCMRMILEKHGLAQLTPEGQGPDVCSGMAQKWLPARVTPFFELLVLRLFSSQETRGYKKKRKNLEKCFLGSKSLKKTIEKDC